MSDKTQEYSELLSQFIFESELSPSPETLESFYSPAPRELKVPVVSSALIQPSVTEFSLPSASSALTESSVSSALAFGSTSMMNCDNYDNLKNETIPTESENQLSTSKRLNDGSSDMNSSTKFFKSLYKYYSDDTIVDTDMIAIETESSTPGTPSLLSDHDGTFSQTSNNFTFYNNELCNNNVDTKPLASNGSVDSKDSQDFKETEVFKEPKERPDTYTLKQLPLLHTTSTYPIQQQLRLAKNRMKTNKKQYRKEESKKNNYIDNEEEIRVLEIVEEYITILGNKVKEQNSIISQATRALTISDMVRQKCSSSLCNEYSNEHLHAERLLLIANLKRTDAVLEMKRLRYEHYLSPKGIAGRFRFRPPGNGKRLVIESLCVPFLTEVTSDLRTKNMTQWQHEIRYFVCVIRATATVYRPPMTIATRLVNAFNESNGSIYQFSLNNHPPYNEFVHWYVEFINKQNDSSDHRYPYAGGSPIIIDGLDNSEWKIIIELFGLHPTESGNSSGNNMEHHKPGGSSAVRTTMFRQLAYFEIPSSEVDRRQFIVNKVHQSGGSPSISKSYEPIGELEVVRISMQMLQDGENYVYRLVNSDLNGKILPTSHEENMFITHNSLKLPPECKFTEGFITLFDDFASRIPFEFEPNETPKWQHFLNKNDKENKNASWTQLWFKVEIINDPNTLKVVNEDYYKDTQLKLLMYPQTVILKYWLSREHCKKNLEPGGIIDLSGCLPLKPGFIKYAPFLRTGLLPAAQPFRISSVRPNTVILQFTAGYKIKNTNDYPDDYCKNEPLLLDFDTLYERDEWCNTINGAVNAIAAHQKQLGLLIINSPIQLATEKK